MNRRTLTLMVALVPIIVFGVLLAAVTVPYVALGPGPTYDTLGEVFVVFAACIGVLFILGVKPGEGATIVPSKSPLTTRE